MSIGSTFAPNSTVRVLVAVDPFLLRTALHQVLSRDDRFEVVLHPSGAPIPSAPGGEDCPPLVLTTRPLDLPDVCVVAVDPVTSDAHVDGGGPYSRHRYEDLDALAALLHRVLLDRGLVAPPARPGDSGELAPTCRQGD